MWVSNSWGQRRIRSVYCDLAYLVHCQYHNMSLISKDALLNSNEQLGPIATYVKQTINSISRNALTEWMRFYMRMTRTEWWSWNKWYRWLSRWLWWWKHPTTCEIKCVKRPSISTDFRLRPLCPTRWILNDIAVSRSLEFTDRNAILQNLLKW